MTVSYGTDKVWRLFLRWRGSVWKATYREILVFLAFFYALNLPYRLWMNEEQRRTFEYWVMHVEHFRNTYIPLSFLLGFYVSMMVARWWQQFELLPWPDNALSLVTYNISGVDEESRIMRRTVARYLNLSALLAFRDFSSRVRKRFPTLEHVVSAGMMTEEEAGLFRDSHINGDLRWLIPLEWSQRIFERLLNQGKITPQLSGIVMMELNAYRLSFRKIFQFIYAGLPLVYTHVAAIAVYSYLALGIVGQQFLDPTAPHVQLRGIHDFDFYVPGFTILQVMFYVGWFKVGMELMDPFGESDNDFDLNYVLDRHIQSSFFMADEVRVQHPSLKEDPYMTVRSVRLPHTLMSLKLHPDQPKFPGDKTFGRHRKMDLSSVRLLDTHQQLQTTGKKGNIIRRAGSAMTLSRSLQLSNDDLAAPVTFHVGRSEESDSEAEHSMLRSAKKVRLPSHRSLSPASLTVNEPLVKRVGRFLVQRKLTESDLGDHARCLL